MSTHTHSAISQLDDLGLALLVCLIGKQHCIIRAPRHLLQNVEAQLTSLASNVFALEFTSVPCNQDTSGQDFLAAFARKSDSTGKVIIARNLDQAQQHVQIEALELMRISRGKGQHSPCEKRGTVIFLALLSEGTPGPPFMVDHLNDHFFMLHDVSENTIMSAQTRQQRPPFYTAASSASFSSLSSVIVKRDDHANLSNSPNTVVPITHDMINDLQAHAEKVRSSAEVRRYVHDIVTFLRMHRGVAGGVSALAARNLPILARILSVLHSLNYIPPSLVSLATRKVFTHRIVVAMSETERSMQWGSDYDAVAEALMGMTPERIVEEVLSSVPCPL